MSFTSILYRTPEEAAAPELDRPPAFFQDLYLDQIVQAITAPAAEYKLAPFYNRQLSSLDAIAYRQEVMQDLTTAPIRLAIQSFAQSMRIMRERLAQAEKLDYYPRARERRFLGAACAYCEAVRALEVTLHGLTPQSRGVQALAEYLGDSVASSPFEQLTTQAEKLRTDLAAIEYSLLLRTGSVTVRDRDTSEDYSVAVEKTFEKFRGAATGHYWLENKKWEGMNHIEAAIHNRVALLHPETFRGLAEFCSVHRDFLDPTIVRFDQEVQFYLTYVSYIERFQPRGLEFSRPEILESSKEIRGAAVFDLALAGKFLDSKIGVVTNDFSLHDPERILVVSGPNQGGKTTFARTIGQLHYLAALGCFVPGRELRLYHFDQLFTHFEREEDVRNLRGKLQDDLVRIHQILVSATPRSLIVMNEIFASTTLQDAIFLARNIMAKISELDVLAVCVTFLDELARFDEKTASIVSMVDPENPARRTFKLERKPADGLAYAMAIAQKYRVTYDALKERIPE
jgi:DNA mismatch repair protein MutS